MRAVQTSQVAKESPSWHWHRRVVHPLMPVAYGALANTVESKRTSMPGFCASLVLCSTSLLCSAREASPSARGVSSS